MPVSTASAGVSVEGGGGGGGLTRGVADEGGGVKGGGGGAGLTRGVADDEAESKTSLMTKEIVAKKEEAVPDG